jgi:hypothetical protein
LGRIKARYDTLAFPHFTFGELEILDVYLKYRNT